MRLPNKEETKEVVNGIFNAGHIVLVFIIELFFLGYICKILWDFAWAKYR